jgi:hypothetical protein
MKFLSGILPAYYILSVVADSSYFYKSLYDKLYNTSYWNQWKPLYSNKNDTWRTCNRIIFKNDVPITIKGINFNGIETNCRIPLGLIDNPLSYFINFLTEFKFNSVRIPIGYETMSNLLLPIGENCQHQDTFIQKNMSSKTMISYLLDTFDKNNISVIFIMPTIIHPNSSNIYNINHDDNLFIKTWLNFIKTFKTHPAIMGVEISNIHPYKIPMNRYLEFCAIMVFNIENFIPEYKGLYFLNGIHSDTDWKDYKSLPSFTKFDHPNILCALSTPIDKFLLSPHVYGPSKRGIHVMNENENDWEKSYGFVSDMDNHWKDTVVLPTEWGMQDMDDKIFYDRWINWHVYIKNFKNGGYYWTLAPYRYDKGSVFDEMYNINYERLAYIDKLTDYSYS